MKTSSDNRFSSGLAYIKRRVSGAVFSATIENGERARLCVEADDANVSRAAAVIIDAVADSYNSGVSALWVQTRDSKFFWTRLFPITSLPQIDQTGWNLPGDFGKDVWPENNC